MRDELKKADEVASEVKATEPWMRGTHGEVGVVARAVVHALELAIEEIDRWCGELSDEAIHARPFELPSIAFELRHMAGAAERVICYAEGKALTEAQLAALKVEGAAEGSAQEIVVAVRASLEQSIARVRTLDEAGLDGVALETPRGVGRKQLPTTLGGALIHVADHTQRHVGQMITTVKVVGAMQS